MHKILSHKVRCKHSTCAWYKWRRRARTKCRGKLENSTGLLAFSQKRSLFKLIRGMNHLDRTKTVNLMRRYEICINFSWLCTLTQLWKFYKVRLQFVDWQPHFICRDCFLLEYWLMKQDLDEMVILRLPQRNCGTASSFNFMQVLCICVSTVYDQMCICQKMGLQLEGCLLGSIKNHF